MYPWCNNQGINSTIIGERVSRGSRDHQWEIRRNASGLETSRPCTGWKEKFVRGYHGNSIDLMEMRVKKYKANFFSFFFWNCILLITKVKLFQGTIDLIVVLKNVQKSFLII